jgi:hypothetical protein
VISPVSSRGTSTTSEQDSLCITSCPAQLISIPFIAQSQIPPPIHPHLAVRHSRVPISLQQIASKRSGQDPCRTYRFRWRPGARSQGGQTSLYPSSRRRRLGRARDQVQTVHRDDITGVDEIGSVQLEHVDRRPFVLRLRTGDGSYAKDGQDLVCRHFRVRAVIEWG